MRPFLELPTAIYGPVGLVAESYLGAALRGNLFSQGEWWLEYDLYGGQIEFEDHQAARKSFKVQEVIGGRLTVYTPVEGLTFGLSIVQAAILEGGLDETTELPQLGVQFTF